MGEKRPDLRAVVGTGLPLASSGWPWASALVSEPCAAPSRMVSPSAWHSAWASSSISWRATRRRAAVEAVTPPSTLDSTARVVRAAEDRQTGASAVRTGSGSASGVAHGGGLDHHDGRLCAHAVGDDAQDSRHVLVDDEDVVMDQTLEQSCGTGLTSPEPRS